MDLDLVFLGTAASVPSAGRGLSSALIRRGGARILLDCGEGTQRQLMRSTGLGDVDVIALTHFHADHVLGLPGMVKTFGLRDRTTPLVIAGPPGLNRFWRTVAPLVGRLPYEVELREVEEGTAWHHGDDCDLVAFPTEHGHGLRSVGWLLREHDRPGRFDVERATRLGVTPGRAFGELQRGGDVVTDAGTTVRAVDVVGEPRTGRRVVYTGDTAACASVRDAARDATLLVHEATFLEVDAERAADTGHSTARDAALTAAAAGVHVLALTHVSTRYPPRDLQAEARSVFEHSHVARDFDQVLLPFPERGEPTWVPGGGRPPRGAAAPDAVEPVGT